MLIISAVGLALALLGGGWAVAKTTGLLGKQVGKTALSPLSRASVSQRPHPHHSRKPSLSYRRSLSRLSHVHQKLLPATVTPSVKVPVPVVPVLPAPDTTAPETTISSKPISPTTATSATLSFEATESDSTFTCKLDAGSWKTCTSPKKYSRLARDDHTFSVRATDAAGNTDATPATSEWTVQASDTTAPDTSITGEPNSPTTSTSASLSFAATEPGATFTCKLDDASWGACISPKSYSGLGLGDHTFSVRAADAAGNTDSTPATDTWTVEAVPDTTVPDTSITAAPTSPTTSTSASLAFDATEPGATFTCKLDSGSWASCTSPKGYTGLSLGDHTFSVRAIDAAGNTDATPATSEWTIETQADTTAPDTSITAQPTSSTTDTAASLSFTADEPGSTFTCKLDDGFWASCASPESYSGLALGEHTFAVRATDAAGNTDTTPATSEWTVVAPSDTTAPETSISAQPSSPTTSTSASLTFASSEPGATFTCKLDSGSWASCTSPKGYTGLSLGDHTFSVRATDAAGNTDATPATDTWTIEAVPPPPPPSGNCDQTVSSISSAQSALTSATVGSVVCLADGSYGSLSLSMKRPAPGVTLRAQNPGQASLGSVNASGAGVTVERFSISGSLNAGAGAERIAYNHNTVAGGAYVIGSSSSYAKNVEIIGNLMNAKTGGGEKDTFMLQRFEGLRIEDNQIWIADEDGNHNDGLQTVWGGRGLIFRGNWMRGGAGSQGFFIKDGEVSNVTFEDNLIAGRPSKPPWGGAPLQFYDTVPNASHPFYTGYGIVIRHNTIWSNPNTSYVRECQNKALLVEYNVMDGWGAPDGTSCVLSQLTQDHNVVTGGTIGKRGPNDTSVTPTFVSTASQDWQLTPSSSGNFSGGRAGITWRPADQVYGP
jgi:hypothetical protein